MIHACINIRAWSSLTLKLTGFTCSWLWFIQVSSLTTSILSLHICRWFSIGSPNSSHVCVTIIHSVMYTLQDIYLYRMLYYIWFTIACRHNTVVCRYIYVGNFSISCIFDQLRGAPRVEVLKSPELNDTPSVPFIYIQFPSCDVLSFLYIPKE